MYKIYDLLRFHATVRSAAPLLILGEKTLTYGEVFSKTEALIEEMHTKGIVAGDRVAVCCDNSEDYMVAILAVWGALAVVAPVETTLPSSERQQLLDISFANWLLQSTPGATSELLIERLLPRTPSAWFSGSQAPAQFLFTSGSSGVPKAVMLSHDSLVAAAIECADSIALRADDIQMTTVPFWHAYGQNRGLNATIFAGASISPVFDDDLSVRVAALKQIRPTVLLSMASFYGFLAFSKQNLGGRLRVAVAGAAPLPAPVLNRFEKLYEFPLLTTYGLTEFLIISCQRLADIRVPGTVGFPSRGVELRIVDEEGNSLPPGRQGRILVRGCLAMQGYLGLPDKNLTSDGWLDTEDIGMFDDNGLRVLGRVSSFIKRSGYKVYPAEIQNCLANHPDVLDLAVVKYNSTFGSEEFAVEVVLKPGTVTTTEQLLQYCRDHLPDYKVPAKCVQVQSIARLPSGKPDLIRISKNAGQHN